MTGRSLPEWVGKSLDEAVPRRVRVRVFTLADGYCARCTRKILKSDKWICDHVQALINGGENREANLQVLCEWCDKPKTYFDVSMKSKSYKRRAKHVGARKRRSSFPTNKDGKWKKKIDGTLVER